MGFDISSVRTGGVQPQQQNTLPTFRQILGGLIRGFDSMFASNPVQEAQAQTQQFQAENQVAKQAHAAGEQPTYTQDLERVEIALRPNDSAARQLEANARDQAIAREQIATGDTLPGYEGLAETQNFLDNLLRNLRADTEQKMQRKLQGKLAANK